MSGDPLIGKKLGDYEIRSVLGQGGMARVYLGHDSVLQRDAAVKVVDPYFVRDDEREEYRDRFLREARAIARLHHPHIVGVYQFGQAEDIYYMAQVFIEGRDLRYILKEHVASNTHMAYSDILRIVTDVADALDYAHREGVIHRDVKPSNIMVTSDGHAVLTDFGLVLNVPEGTIGTTFGSVHYIAPEQAESSRMAVPQSDLYALGIVLYEMLSGRVPFDDASIMSVALKQLNEAPPPPSTFNPALSSAVEAVVLRALAKDPSRRYQTGTELVAALERALGMTDDDEITRPLMLPLSKAVPLPGAPLPAWTEAGPNEHTLHADTSTTPVPPPPGILTESTTHAPPASASQASPPKAAPASSTPRSRTWLYVAAGLVAIVLVVAAGAALVSGLGGDAPVQAASPTNEATGTIAAAAQEPTATATREPAPSATHTTAPSATSTVTAIVAAASTRATSTPRATATDAPTSTSTRRPAATSAVATPTVAAQEVALLPSPAADSGAVRLVYDAQSLTLLNVSAEEVDVSGLVFTQTRAEGNPLIFRSSSWNTGSAPTTHLPAGDCYQVWTNEDTLLEPAEGCGVRHAWSQVSFPRWFWISDAADAVFSVARDGVVLAECRVDAGVCDLDVD